MSEVQNIEDRVKAIIADQLAYSPDAIELDKSIATDYGADSIDQVEIVMAIEDSFGFYIPDDDAWRLDKVQQFVDAVRSRV